MEALTAFRFSNWDTPLWASANRRPGRFGVVGDTVQYWCLHPFGCWAEHLRLHNITDLDEAAELRPRPWVARVPPVPEIPRLTSDNAASHGLDAESLVDDDWSACQRWARVNAGLGAVIAPSAALPGTENLILFGPRSASAGRARLSVASTSPPRPSPTWRSACPSCSRTCGTAAIRIAASRHGKGATLPSGRRAST